MPEEILNDGVVAAEAPVAEVEAAPVENADEAALNKVAGEAAPESVEPSEAPVAEEVSAEESVA